MTHSYTPQQPRHYKKTSNKYDKKQAYKTQDNTSHHTKHKTYSQHKNRNNQRKPHDNNTPDNTGKTHQNQTPRQTILNTQKPDRNIKKHKNTYQITRTQDKKPKHTIQHKTKTRQDTSETN